MIVLFAVRHIFPARLPEQEVAESALAAFEGVVIFIAFRYIWSAELIA